MQWTITRSHHHQHGCMMHHALSPHLFSLPLKPPSPSLGRLHQITVAAAADSTKTNIDPRCSSQWVTAARQTLWIKSAAAGSRDSVVAGAVPEWASSAMSLDARQSSAILIGHSCGGDGHIDWRWFYYQFYYDDDTRGRQALNDCMPVFHRSNLMLGSW